MSDAVTVQPRPLISRALIGFSAGLPNGGILDQSSAGRITGQQKALIGAVPIRGESPADYQRNGTAVRVRGFEQHPVVSACVRAIVDIIAAVPLEVYKKVPKAQAGKSDIELIPNNPAQTLLDSPSPFLSAQRMRGILATHFVVYGNGFWYLERPDPSSPTAMPQPPATLRVIQPEDVMTTYVNDKGYPVAYLWRDYLGYTHSSPSVDLVHFRDLNARGLVFGYPRAASALNDIIGDNEASQYTREVVTNSGWAGMIMLMGDESSTADALTAQAQWEEKMTTRGGRGKTAWVGGVKDVKPMGFNLRDLEFPDLRRVTREDICAAFGVDPRMVGITSAARDAGLSGEQYASARERLIQQTIEPIMRALESEMNLWLMPEFGDVYVRFSPDALQALVEDDTATSKRVIEEVKAQIRTVEEGRTTIGLEEAFPDDDHLLVSGQGTSMVTVATALAGAESIPGAPLNADGSAKTPEQLAAERPTPAALDASGKGAKADSGKDLQDTEGKDPNNKKGAPVSTKTPTAEEEAKKKARAALGSIMSRGVALTSDQRRMLWEEFDRRASKDEAAYRRQAAMLFADERESVSRIFTRQIEAAKGAGVETDRAAAGTVENPHGAEQHYLDAAKRTIRTMYKPGGDVRQRWNDRFRPLIGNTYADGGISIAARVKKRSTRADEPFSFDLHNPRVQQAIADRARRLAELVGDTTATNITDAIALGEEEGLSLSEIAKLIDLTAFGGDAGYRSKMIARTETIGALNQGQFDTANHSGVIQQKEWLTQNDDRVRDSHAECEDEGRIDMDAEFDATGMQYPGDSSGDAEDVINCRCTLLYYDDKAAGEDDQEDSEPANAVATRRAAAEREKWMAELVRSVAVEAKATGKEIGDVLAARMDRLEQGAASTKEWLEGVERSRAGVAEVVAAAIAKQPAPVVNVEVNLPARGPTKSTRNTDGSVTTEEVIPTHKDG